MSKFLFSYPNQHYPKLVAFPAKTAWKAGVHALTIPYGLDAKTLQGI
jgi:hypothetical protein